MLVKMTVVYLSTVATTSCDFTKILHFNLDCTHKKIKMGLTSQSSRSGVRSSTADPPPVPDIFYHVLAHRLITSTFYFFIFGHWQIPPHVTTPFFTLLFIPGDRKCPFLCFSVLYLNWTTWGGVSCLCERGQFHVDCDVVWIWTYARLRTWNLSLHRQRFRLKHKEVFVHDTSGHVIIYTS